MVPKLKRGGDDICLDVPLQDARLNQRLGWMPREGPQPGGREALPLQPWFLPPAAQRLTGLWRRVGPSKGKAGLDSCLGHLQAGVTEQ